jgi:hypothetical protein
MAKGAAKAIEKGRKKKDSDEAYHCSSKKAAGGQKPEKDPNQPKRPMSSYFHFLNSRRVSLKKEQPDLLMGPSTKLMTAEWHKFTDKDKIKFEKLAADDKQRYFKECKEKGIKCKAADKDAADNNPNPPPKKPQSAYFLYQASARDRIKKDKPDIKQSEIMKMVGKEWSDLDDKKKKKWEGEADKDKVRYEKEKSAWDKL